jgi:NitT/TauT family transport system substrate-binding protein
MRNKLWITSALLVVIALVLGACATPTAAPAAAPAAEQAASTDAGAACATKDPVTLQLKWVAQAQFAGYYAAQGEGFYDAECLDITINPGGPDIVPEQVVAGGQADFGINFVPSLLSAREGRRTNLVNIAQVFERSAMREISWKDTGIESPADLAGKKVAVWFGGNEFELLATLAKYGIDKDTGVQLIQQPFDMNLLLERQVDAAAAMTYNELAQVLETPDQRRQPLHHRPAQHHRLQRRRHGHAARWHLHHRAYGWPTKPTRTSPSASCALRSAAGCSAATTWRSAWTTCWSKARPCPAATRPG